MQHLIQITEAIIAKYGYAGIFLLTTTEQFIQPVPADIFIGAGTAAGLPLLNVMLVVIVSTFLGSLIGYFLGDRLGHPAATWLFGKTAVQKGEAFMKKWGLFAVIIAGVTPIPFKVITWMAGIFEMPLKRFVLGVLIGRIPRYILVGYAGVWAAKLFKF